MKVVALNELFDVNIRWPSTMASNVIIGLSGFPFDVAIS